MRRLFTLALTLAGILLLITTPSRSQAYTPTRFTVVVEGAESGSAVLLLPGLTSGREVFDAEAKLIAPSHRLYRVQVNGFAGQPAGPNASGPIFPGVVEELHQYIVANHLHPAVIGHSLGGLLGLMLAQAHPEDVQKLLVVDSLPFYALVFNAQATVETAGPQAMAMRDMLLKQTPEQMAAGTAATAAMLVKNAEGVKVVTGNSLASDRAVFAEAMYEDLTTDIRPQLKGIKTPTLVLYPYDTSFQGGDPGVVDSLYRGAYSTMPNVKLKRVDDSRHFIMYDQPKDFASAVNGFLKP